MDDQGNRIAESRHYPYGEERWSDEAVPTDYRWTGQRQHGYIKLYQMGARFYDSALGRWISADTLVPDPENPQSFNRYSWVRNHPLNRVDPKGHQDELPELMRQAIGYFTSLGWQVVGDPSLINQYWNGADLVFTTGSGDSIRVLAVELKDVMGNVNLGTLGRSKVYGDYGGSIERILRSASRFANSTKDQLRLMSQTVLKGNALGTLQNALFTSAKGVPDEAVGVSEGAQAQFNGVFRVLQDGKIGAIKNEIESPGFWARVGAATSTAWSTVRAWGTQLVTDLCSATTSLPIFYLPYGALDPMQSPWAPWYREPVMN
jgi:RHS repeat-associated protein